MRRADDDGPELRSFGRRTAWKVALVVGEIYAAILFLTTWLTEGLTIEFAVLTEVFVLGTAVVAAALFGWVAVRPWLAHPLIYAIVGVISVIVGRVASALLFMGAAGAYALTKAPGSWPQFLAVLAPESLGFAVLTAVLTLFVPEIIGFMAGVALLGMVRGRFPHLMSREV